MSHYITENPLMIPQSMISMVLNHLNSDMTNIEAADIGWGLARGFIAWLDERCASLEDNQKLLNNALSDISNIKDDSSRQLTQSQRIIFESFTNLLTGEQDIIMQKIINSEQDAHYL